MALLTLTAGSLQAQLTNLGFEADTPGSTAVTDWVNWTPENGSVQVSAADQRSGSRTLAYAITGSAKGEMRSVSSIKVRNNSWVHVIAWAVAKNAKSKGTVGLAVGMENAESDLLGGTLTPGNSPSQLTLNYQYTKGGVVPDNAYVKLFVTPVNGAASTVCWDDVVVYTNGTQYLDSTAPGPPGAVTLSAATDNSLKVSWSDSAGDDVSYASGLAGYLVVRGTSAPTNVPLANATYRTNYNSSIGVGTVVYSGTATSFTDSGLLPGTTYFYRVYAFDNALNYSTGVTASATTTCAAPIPSSLTVEPALPVCAGTSVTLTQTPSGGSAPYSYRWLRNGSIIGGATTSTLTIPDPVQGDKHSCEVRSSCGGNWVASPELQLQVSQPPALTLLVGTNLLGNEGEPMVLRVQASGTGLSYQWRKEGVAVGGATNSALAFNALSFGDAGKYDVVVINGPCATNSGAVVLQVNRLPLAPTVQFTRARGISLKISLAELVARCSDPDQDAVSFVRVDTGTHGAQVSYDETFIYYLPANDQDDVLSYLVKDSRGGSISGRIEIGVFTEVVEARAISVADGVVRVRFAAIPNHGYRVERCGTLSGMSADGAWEQVGSGKVPAGGVLEFVDEAPPGTGAYYRLVVVPE